MAVPKPILLGVIPILIVLAGCRSSMPERMGDQSTRALPLPADNEWLPLLTGELLDGWEVIQFGGEGEVEGRDGTVVLNRGEPFTGIRRTNSIPTQNYELELEAVRLQGNDFFCGLTVPVGESHCTLILGGWGGGVVGISSLDGMDASENQTGSYRRFEDKRWYRIRLRITEHRIQAWLDDECVVDVSTVDHQVGLRSGMIEMTRPLGICSWETTAGIRNVRVRTLEAGGL